MNATNVIEQIVGQMQAKEQERVKRLTEECKTLLTVARQEARKILDQVDGLYETLRPYIQEETQMGATSRGQACVQLKWTIQSDELELSPVVVNIEMPSNFRHWSGTYISANGYRKDDLALLSQVIVYAHETYREWKEKQLGQFEESHIGSLYPSNHNEETMQQAYQALVEALPDRKDKYDGYRARWYKAKNDREEQERVQQEQKRKTEIAKETLRDQWVEYLKTRIEIEASNEEKRQALQNELDQPFEAYLLTYSYIGSNDEEYDGEHYAETGEVWVKHEQPDDSGYWECFNGRKVKYLHLVSIEKRTVKPTDLIAGLYFRRSWSEFGVSLVFQPGTDNAVIDAYFADLGFELIPERPQSKVYINDWEESLIIGEARKLAFGEDPELEPADDIPF